MLSLADMLQDYYRILSELPDNDYEAAVAYLETALPDYFEETYDHQFGNSEIVHFRDHTNGSYQTYFDCTEEAGVDFYSRTARVVCVLARSKANTTKRDASRQQNFIGSFEAIAQYRGYDKGHFIAHDSDGQLDQNIFPQLRSLNRGLSPQGRLYRAMERYVQRNPGVFYFIRPLYNDPSWIPAKLDFGILTPEGGMLLNRFDNLVR